MRIFLFVVIGIHGLIHLMGFLKSMGLIDPNELTIHITRSFGWLWLIASLLILTTSCLYLLKYDFYWITGLAAVILSQFLIIYFWHDAKFGTIANLILLALIAVGYASWNFKNNYKHDVKANLERTIETQTDILTDKDLLHLPALVRAYLNYTGVVNKPKVINTRVTFDAMMRSNSQDWFPLEVEQYDFFDQYVRLFYLNATVKGLPTQGYHKYVSNQANMTIKALSMIPVARHSGEDMFRAETVTLFNDMCFLAPATLIDKNITWTEINDHSVKASFTNQSVTISATLIFNEQGQLINFISDDRYDVVRQQTVRFSTPLGEYRNINGYHLPGYGEAIWHYPEGPFVYGKYKVKNIEYNVSSMQ